MPAPSAFSSVIGMPAKCNKNKNLSLSLGLGTDTVRPLGNDGNDVVVLDFERAPDNITSWNFSVTGTL